MGVRYHVVSRVIEYGQASSCSGNATDLIDAVLFHHCEECYQDENQTEIEVNKEEFKKVLEDLKQGNLGDEIKEFNEKHRTNYNAQDHLIPFFEQCLKECDKDYDYIRLDLF